MGNPKTNNNIITLFEWQLIMDSNTPYSGFVDGGKNIGIFYTYADAILEKYTQQDPFGNERSYPIYYHHIRYNYHVLPIKGYTQENSDKPFPYQFNDELIQMGYVDEPDSTDWTNFGKGIRGPLTTGSSAPIIPKDSRIAKSIWKESRLVGNARKNTSLASLIFRRTLHKVKPWKILPKAVSLGGQLGRLAGRVFVPVGILLTVYDAYVFLDRPLDEIGKEMRENSLSTTGVNYPSVKNKD